MKKTVYIFFIFALAQGSSVPAQQTVEKRVGKLESRVGRVEERVSSLEDMRGVAPGAGDQDSLKVQPLTVTLISKKQVIEPGQVAIKMILEFKNLTSYAIGGFSGTLVFKPEGGDIYTRKMAYSHAVESGDTAQIEMTIGSSQTKQYLKFVKAKGVKVVFINQKLF